MQVNRVCKDVTRFLEIVYPEMVTNYDKNNGGGDCDVSKALTNTWREREKEESKFKNQVLKL